MTKDIIKLMNGDGRWYIKAAGLSTDPKPVEGISPDSYFYEADTGDEYRRRRAGVGEDQRWG